MIIYFGVLKEGINYVKIKKKLTEAGLIIRNYYPALKIVKFESENKITQADFDFFVAIEEEKNDFSIQM